MRNLNHYCLYDSGDAIRLYPQPSSASLTDLLATTWLYGRPDVGVRLGAIALTQMA